MIVPDSALVVSTEPSALLLVNVQLLGAKSPVNLILIAVAGLGSADRIPRAAEVARPKVRIG